MRTTSGGHYLPESSPKVGLQLHSENTREGVRHCFVLGWCSEGPSAGEHTSVLGFAKTSCGDT